MNKVLMIGPELTVKGGMASVVKNYLSHDQWDHTSYEYVASYRENGKVEMVKFFIKSYKLIKKKLKTEPIDIIHIHMSERGSFFRKALLMKLCRKYQKKVIIHHHGAEFVQFYNHVPNMVKKWIRNELSKADLNIVLSKRLVDSIKNIEMTSKVDYLYNAVPTYEVKPYNNEGYAILFLGRLGKRKGTYDLLEAIKLLDDRIHKKYKFYLCGDGEIDLVKSKCKEMGIEHRIGHVGWIESAQKEKIFKETILNVLPSYNEGLPMTILETMAYGIPNISTRIASIPEVIEHEKNGALIEPGDYKSLALWIERIVTQPMVRLNMSDESYSLISKSFSINKHVDLLEQYYSEVMSNDKRTS